jgi:hypothetical protein
MRSKSCRLLKWFSSLGEGQRSSPTRTAISKLHGITLFNLWDGKSFESGESITQLPLEDTGTPPVGLEVTWKQLFIVRIGMSWSSLCGPKFDVVSKSLDHDSNLSRSKTLVGWDWCQYMELVPLVDVVVVRGSEDSGWRGESWRRSVPMVWQNHLSQVEYRSHQLDRRLKRTATHRAQSSGAAKLVLGPEGSKGRQYAPKPNMDQKLQNKKQKIDQWLHIELETMVIETMTFHRQ